MKIIKYGELTFREGEGPDVHGWIVEREESDPADATTEQLILGFAILWAREKFQKAVNSAVIEVLRQHGAQQTAEAAMKTRNTEN